MADLSPPGYGICKFPCLTLAQLEGVVLAGDFPEDHAAIVAEIAARKAGASVPYGGLCVP